MDNTRRAFIRTAAALGAGAAAAALTRTTMGEQDAGRGAPGAAPPSAPPVAPPAAPPAAPRATAAPLVVGTGSLRFEVQHDWLTPPADAAWGDTHGVAQDAAGNIYVAHTVHPSSRNRDAVLVFDRTGKFLRSFGSEFAGGAHGLDLRDEGGTEFLYHCDINRRRVVKTALDGSVVWEVGVPMESGAYTKPEEWCPTNSAFGPDGMLIVGDGYGSSYVHVFDSMGKWKRVLCKPGAEEGQTRCPHGLTVDTRGTMFTKEPTICVADRGNRRLQYFALDGKPLGVCAAGMRQPCDMKVRGELLLVPDLDSVLTILDGKNQPAAQFCDGNPSSLRGAPREKFIPGKFVHPHDAIWLADGSILVAEWVPIGRITRLKAVA